MATTTEILDEGVEYTITVNTPVDTSGETLTAKLFPRFSSGSWTVGTAAGDSADTDITIALDSSARAPGEYLLEVWVDIDDTNGNRDLIEPDEGDTQIINIQNRKAVGN